jgi:hypothetical protein
MCTPHGKPATPVFFRNRLSAGLSPERGGAAGGCWQGLAWVGGSAAAMWVAEAGLVRGGSGMSLRSTAVRGGNRLGMVCSCGFDGSFG